MNMLEEVVDHILEDKDHLDKIHILDLVLDFLHNAGHIQYVVDNLLDMVLVEVDNLEVGKVLVVDKDLEVDKLLILEEDMDQDIAHNLVVVPIQVDLQQFQRV